MSTKLLLNIALPATRRVYEFWVPQELTVPEVTRLLARILEEQESPYFEDSPLVSLHDGATGEELNPEVRIGSLNYSNGTQLILF